MTDYRILDAKPWHCGQLARRLREEQSSALSAAGVAQHLELRRRVDAATIAKVALRDGRAIAIWAVEGGMIADEAFVWLHVSQAAQDLPIAMVREARAHLREYLARWSRLSTVVYRSDSTSLRFAEFLGFRRTEKLLPSDALEMEIRAEWDLARLKDVAPFVVFGLPRSRTKWLSEFLAYKGRSCGHDLPVMHDSPEDVLAILARGGGTVETGLVPAWRAIRERFPEARFVVVRREIPSVRASGAAHNWAWPEGWLERQERFLEEISAEPGTLTVHFDELYDETICAEIFEFCLRKPFDREWWGQFHSRNIQIDMQERMRALQARAAAIGEFFVDVYSRVTIQAKSFGSFYRDSADLRTAHYAEAGSIDGLPLDPNIEMALALEASGQLLVVTGRLPDRLVGYIVFLINPSFESRGVLIGHQNIFFVAREFRGRLGTRLHAFARARLIKMGVTLGQFRSGVRARGPAQKHLFKRLGATSMGELYTMKLEA